MAILMETITTNQAEFLAAETEKAEAQAEENAARKRSVANLHEQIAALEKEQQEATAMAMATAATATSTTASAVAAVAAATKSAENARQKEKDAGVTDMTKEELAEAVMDEEAR